MEESTQTIIRRFKRLIGKKDFPCIAAKAALSQNELQCVVAGDMRDRIEDNAILNRIYQFVRHFRQMAKNQIAEAGIAFRYQSLAIIFRQPNISDEACFEKLMWQKLQALADLDASNYSYDSRVSNDPEASSFSFSLMEEAFFVIGLHAASIRKSRRFHYPVLVFNPHEMFEELRKQGRYETMKTVVRKRDAAYSGSVNPMLIDFGKKSEAHQYSGRFHESDWTCPFISKHAANKHHTSPQWDCLCPEKGTTTKNHRP